MAETITNESFRNGNIQTFPATVKNETGSEVTLLKGSLLVFDSSDGYFKAYAGGVEKPTAIVNSDLTISAASNTTAAVVVVGDINGSKLVLPGSYALDDVPSSNAGVAMAITAGGSNVGNGAAGTITQGSLAKAGTYTLTCTAEASNAGTFQVVDPDGFVMAPLTVAVAYDNGAFGVTIADGAEDFDIGDTFTVVGDVDADGSIRIMLKERGLVCQDIIQMVS